MYKALVFALVIATLSMSAQAIPFLGKYGFGIPFGGYGYGLGLGYGLGGLYNPFLLGGLGYGFGGYGYGGYGLGKGLYY